MIVHGTLCAICSATGYQCCNLDFFSQIFSFKSVKRVDVSVNVVVVHQSKE